MALRPRREQENSEERVIEINAHMQGTLSFKDPVNLKINGHFTGTLEAKGTLTVGSTAGVEAHLTGENIIIAGKVRGDVIARKMLVLMPTAVLTGNISTPKLNIVEGAVFQGRCQMMEDALSIEEVAKYLEIDSPAIMELAASGKIPATRTGDGWVFERSKIDVWASTAKVS